MAFFRSNTNPFQKYLNLNEQSPTLGLTATWDLHQQFLTRKKYNHGNILYYNYNTLFTNFCTNKC